MAIIRCVECGNSISDKAESCPYCGAPASIQMPHGECTFTIEYVTTRGIQKKAVFCLDGQQLYTVKPGDKFECTTTSGQHTVDIMQRDRVIGRLPVLIDRQGITVAFIVDGNKAKFRVTDRAKKKKDETSDILREMNDREKEKQKNNAIAGMLVAFVVLLILLLLMFAGGDFADSFGKTINDVFGFSHHYEITIQPMT